MSTFDRLKNTAFNVVQRTMGDDAIWYVEADINGNTMLSKVLFNAHTKDETLGQQNYNFDRPTIEFKVGDFKGLKQHVESGIDVLIYVGDKFYYGVDIKSPSTSAKDGDTLILLMEEADEYNTTRGRDS